MGEFVDGGMNPYAGFEILVKIIFLMSLVFVGSLISNFLSKWYPHPYNNIVGILITVTIYCFITSLAYILDKKGDD